MTLQFDRPNQNMLWGGHDYQKSIRFSFLYCETSSHNVKDAIVVKLVFLKVVNVTDNTPSINTIRLRNNDEVHPVKFSL